MRKNFIDFLLPHALQTAEWVFLKWKPNAIACGMAKKKKRKKKKEIGIKSEKQKTSSFISKY